MFLHNLRITRRMTLNRIIMARFDQLRAFRSSKYRVQIPNQNELKDVNVLTKNQEFSSVSKVHNQGIGEICPTLRVVPMLLNKNESAAVLPFDEVPGPKMLKYLSIMRQYLSDFGTQVTAGILTIGLNFGNYLKNKKPVTLLSALFDEYGPVVRFVSPLGGDIVLINHPDHIEKIFTIDGKYPVRSTLDSLDKYRKEHRNRVYGGLYTIHGEEWNRQRSTISIPLRNSLDRHLQGIYDVSESFTQKVYNLRNYQDEVPNDLYKEIHKWAFDCIALIIFAKKFGIIEMDETIDLSDLTWLYNNLNDATKAILKCESGLHTWKLFATPAWYSLVKSCGNLDNLIAKCVLEVEQSLHTIKPEGEITLNNMEPGDDSLISAMLSSEGMGTEDVSTILMDMLIIGVNTVSSTMSFLLYDLAKYQNCQNKLYQEVKSIFPEFTIEDINRIKNETPYLQACIKEALRLTPPIPILTRILAKNTTLDRYNIPRGTTIIMSTRDSALKESNYDDANKFRPNRWLSCDDALDYHAFASIPFGFGARKCLGQKISETMLSILTIKLIQKYHLEYHYGDIEPTKTFISKPNKPVKIRFIDRY